MRIWTVGIALVFSLAACAGDSDSPAQPAPVAAEVARPTHNIAPSASQAAAYRAELSKLLAKRALSDRRVRTAGNNLTGGHRHATVDGMGNVALARYGAGGQIDHACLDDVDQAMSFLSNVDANGLEVK